MHIVVCASAAEAARTVADHVTEAMARRPELVMALPAGRTPIPLYRELTRRHRAKRLDFNRVTIFAIDEFVGLDATDRASFACFLRRHFVRHVDVAPGCFLTPDGCAPDLVAEAGRYDRAIAAAGGLDMAIVGIGGNGHVGFNEPADALESATHVARLSTATRRVNAASFGGDARQVPRAAITMGMGTLLRAREIVLLATGAAKARIVARALHGPVTTRIPASLLQLHPNCLVVLDVAASTSLTTRNAKGHEESRRI